MGICNTSYLYNSSIDMSPQINNKRKHSLFMTKGNDLKHQQVNITINNSLENKNNSYNINININNNINNNIDINNINSNHINIDTNTIYENNDLICNDDSICNKIDNYDIKDIDLSLHTKYVKTSNKFKIIIQEQYDNIVVIVINKNTENQYKIIIKSNEEILNNIHFKYFDIKKIKNKYYFYINNNYYTLKKIDI